MVFTSFSSTNYQTAVNFTQTAVNFTQRVDVLSIEYDLRTHPVCQDLPVVSTIVTPNLSDNPLVWPFGDATGPASLHNGIWPGCVAEVITFRVPEEGAFVAGDTLVFTAETSSEDQDPTCSSSVDVTFTLAVPGEMRMEVSPICQDDGQPAFLVAASNSGGTDINNIVVDAFVPGFYAGDPSTASAIFAGVADVPAGATLQVSADAVACDDGEICTVNDMGSGGSCVPGATDTCGDSDVCTADGCVFGVGC